MRSSCGVVARSAAPVTCTQVASRPTFVREQTKAGGEDIRAAGDRISEQRDGRLDLRGWWTLGSQVVRPASVGRPHHGCPPTPTLLRTSNGPTPLLSRRRPPVLGDLVVVDEIGRRKDEHLSHDVRMLMVAAHEADHPGRSHAGSPPGSARASPPQTPSAAGSRTSRGRPPTASALRARSPRAADTSPSRPRSRTSYGSARGRRTPSADPPSPPRSPSAHHRASEACSGRLTGSQQDRVCSRSQDHPVVNVSAHANGETYIARSVLALRLAREPCAMDKGDDLEPPAPDTLA